MTSMDQTRTAAALTPASISLAEYNAMKARDMTEAQLQAAIIAQAKRYGWIVYHTHDSRRSEPGYPDLHLVHAGHQLSLFRELKTQKGKLSADQVKWGKALEATGQDFGVWRPIDWFDGTIDGILLPDMEARG